MTIPLGFHEEFSVANEGNLPARGTKIPIVLLIRDHAYDAFIVNVDREAVASDTLQIRYDSNKELKRLLADQLQASLLYLEAEREAKQQPGKRVLAKVPEDQAEYLEFYSTGVPFRYRVDVITSCPSPDESTRQALAGVDEQTIEHSMSTMSEEEFTKWAEAVGGQAGVGEHAGLVRHRRYQRSVNTNLKVLYGGACQVCGWSSMDDWGVDVSEIHHIDPFARSFNHKLSNLMVLCPTHHRLVHATNAAFDRSSQSYTCAAGLVLKVVLDRHLK